MLNITFTENLQKHVACPAVKITGSTLGEALDKIFQANPAIKSYLVDDQSQVRKHILIAVNGDILQNKSLSTPIPSNASVHIAQALSGG